MTLTINVDYIGNTTVIALDGELDLHSYRDVAELAAQNLTNGHLNVIIDLSRLNFCDSAGLRTFIRHRNNVQAKGGQLILAAPQHVVRRVLEISGLVDFFGCYETIDEARTCIEE
ncbi:STAS domain-containing protein [Luedemannella flava]|uniref:Anti-sigma factor antagonist n=1 Tax=Luedemannella flava TaxID=349316 RepID=A0ABN2LWV6_9ACTN